MERYRIVPGIAPYYITFTVVEWLQVFIDETACGIVTDVLNFCIGNPYEGNSIDTTAHEKAGLQFHPASPTLRQIARNTDC